MTTTKMDIFKLILKFFSENGGHVITDTAVLLIHAKNPKIEVKKII